MQLYSSDNCYKLYQGSMLDMLECIDPNTIDSIVCDPPYELNFMNKGWDNSGIAFQKDTWERCYTVLKPGGYLLAFGGSRTFHRIACAIEDAGFEIRDTIMWLYGSGFPKSMNIGLAIDKKEGVQGQRGVGGFNVGGIQEQQNRTAKLYIGSTTDGSKQDAYTDYKSDLAKQWAGWGTALKPAYEPIIVARKPCEGSTTDNVLKWGVGGINIDGCRIDYNGEVPNIGGRGQHTRGDGYGFKAMGDECIANSDGRFPANTILTYDETDEKEVCGGMPDTKSNGGATTMPDLRDVGKKSKESIGIDKLSFGQVSNADRKQSDYVAPMDSGSAARYFYCAKASKKDRDEGLEEFAETSTGKLRNVHPTVKPTELMQYLVRLVSPKGSTVLDPFNGSGSTGKAVMYENIEHKSDYKYIGIELTEQYLPIAKARIEYAETGVLACVDGKNQVAHEAPVDEEKAKFKLF